MKSMSDAVLRSLRLATLFVGLPAILAGCSQSIERHDRLPIVVHSVNINYNNSHLIQTPQGLLLVDAGMHTDAQALETKLTDAGIDLTNLQAVIVTHGHADHAGGAAHFQQKYSVPIIAGAGDRTMMAAGRNDRLCPTGFLAERFLEDAQSATYPSTKVDIAIDQPTALTDALGIEGLPGVLEPIAGHTPGSLALTMPDAAFVGDLFRGGIVFNQATRHFFMCDLDDNQRDIAQYLAETAADVETFFTGHFGPVDRASALRLAANMP